MYTVVASIIEKESSQNVSKPSIQYRLYPAQEVIRPLWDHICWIKRNYIILVFLINPKLVTGTVHVMAVSGNAKIFDERAALEGIVRMPNLELPSIHYSRRLFVNVRDATALEKLPYLTLCARFVLRPSSCLVTAIVHAIWR
jgi:hypothetical protein